MTSRLNPYIAFSDNARQALEFYRGVFGGDLVLSTFGEAGGAEGPDADKIMHGQLETPAGYTLVAADTPAGMDRTDGSTRPTPVSRTQTRSAFWSASVRVGVGSSAMADIVAPPSAGRRWFYRSRCLSGCSGPHRSGTRRDHERNRVVARQ